MRELAQSFLGGSWSLTSVTTPSGVDPGQGLSGPFRGWFTMALQKDEAV